jgi:phosphatidylserine decarboxylase
MFGRLLIAFVSVLPTHLLSRAAGRLATIQLPRRLRAPAHRAFSALAGVRLDEVEAPLHDYPSLNAFFTRGLRPGVRPIAADAIVSPADAAVGASGPVIDDTLIQAKGRDYSLAGLLCDASLADRLEGGTYLTLYLSPRDYHRLHWPLTGVVERATYVPGRLWPVNVHAVVNVADLFAVNERLVLELRRPNGGLCVVVLVGATMVGMTRLAFDDLHTNVRRGRLTCRDYDPPVAAVAGQEMGHFEFGSTVIMIYDRRCGTLHGLPPEWAVRVGEAVGRIGDD